MSAATFLVSRGSCGCSEVLVTWLASVQLLLLAFVMSASSTLASATDRSCAVINRRD